MKSAACLLTMRTRSRKIWAIPSFARVLSNKFLHCNSDPKLITCFYLSPVSGFHLYERRFFRGWNVNSPGDVIFVSPGFVFSTPSTYVQQCTYTTLVTAVGTEARADAARSGHWFRHVSLLCPVRHDQVSKRSTGRTVLQCTIAFYRINVFFI